MVGVKADLPSQRTAPLRISGELPSAPAAGGATTPIASGEHASQPGLNFIQPRPLRQVMPNTRLFGISTLQIAKDVAIKVAIDDRGRVVRAEALNAGRKGMGLLTSAALAAARQWTFQPAKIHGVRVASEHTIVFRFAAQIH